MDASGIASEVLINGQFGAATETEDGLDMKFIKIPALRLMICQGQVAFVTSEIGVATAKPDSDDVEGRVVVSTACAAIDTETVDHINLDFATF